MRSLRRSSLTRMRFVFSRRSRNGCGASKTTVSRKSRPDEKSGSDISDVTTFVPVNNGKVRARNEGIVLSSLHAKETQTRIIVLVEFDVTTFMRSNRFANCLFLVFLVFCRFFRHS